MYSNAVMTSNWNNRAFFSSRDHSSFVIIEVGRLQRDKNCGNVRRHSRQASGGKRVILLENKRESFSRQSYDESFDWLIDTLRSVWLIARLYSSIHGSVVKGGIFFQSRLSLSSWKCDICIYLPARSEITLLLIIIHLLHSSWGTYICYCHIHLPVKALHAASDLLLFSHSLEISSSSYFGASMLRLHAAVMQIAYTGNIYRDAVRSLKSLSMI